MKTISILMACIAITVSPVIAQVCTPPEPTNLKAAVGIWKGHYTENGETKTLMIEFREVEGQLQSYVDMPDRNIKNARFEIDLCSCTKLHLKRTGADNQPLWLTGKPVDGKMTGSFKVGDVCGNGPSNTFSVAKVSKS